MAFLKNYLNENIEKQLVTLSLDQPPATAARWPNESKLTITKNLNRLIFAAAFKLIL